MMHYGKKPEKNITKTFRKEEEERLEIIRVTLKNWDLVFLQDHTDFGTKRFPGHPWCPNVLCFVKSLTTLINKSINLN